MHEKKKEKLNFVGMECMKRMRRKTFICYVYFVVHLLLHHQICFRYLSHKSFSRWVISNIRLHAHVCNLTCSLFEWMNRKFCSGFMIVKVLVFENFVVCVRNPHFHILPQTRGSIHSSFSDYILRVHLGLTILISLVMINEAILCSSLVHDSAFCMAFISPYHPDRQKIPESSNWQPITLTQFLLF